MICRSKEVLNAGGFDPHYFLYFEDFDLSLRLKDQGKLVFHPGMKIIHGGGHAARKGISHIIHFVRSALRFFNTHGWKWY
jgi:GT2 family glycosyltransferase